MKDEENSRTGRIDLAMRTKQFALRAIKVFCAIPKTTEGEVLGKQFLRSATSVGAHYRDFVSKVEGALQELEETGYWLELISESGILPATRLQDLLTESSELTAILVTIVKKAKGL